MGIHQFKAIAAALDEEVQDRNSANLLSTPYANSIRMEKHL
jgi:hypothetical protein